MGWNLSTLKSDIKHLDGKDELKIIDEGNENGFDYVMVRYNNPESVLNEETYTLFIKDHRTCLILSDDKNIKDSSEYPKGVPFVIDIIRDDVEHMELPNSVQDLHRRLNNVYSSEDIYEGVVDIFKGEDRTNYKYFVYFVFGISDVGFEVVFDLFNGELSEGDNVDYEGIPYYNTFKSELIDVKKSNHQKDFKFKNPDSRYNLYQSQLKKVMDI